MLLLEHFSAKLQFVPAHPPSTTKFQRILSSQKKKTILGAQDGCGVHFLTVFEFAMFCARAPFFIKHLVY